eukprot:scaffold32639_cov112-Isochrysis_galbana.AAC.6
MTATPPATSKLSNTRATRPRWTPADGTTCSGWGCKPPMMIRAASIEDAGRADQHVCSRGLATRESRCIVWCAASTASAMLGRTISTKPSLRA